MTPQLQLAIDAPEHFAVLAKVAHHFDIIEVGTPVLKRFGLSAIATARELGGGRPVLADTKTVDGGAFEANMVFAAGAAMMTALANCPRATLEAVARVAATHDGIVVYDTILDDTVTPEHLAGCGQGPTWLALHHSFDARMAGSTDQRHIEAVAQRQAQGFRVSLAGGIGPDNLAHVLDNPPEVIVIGSAVTNAADPEKEAAWIAQQIAN